MNPQHTVPVLDDNGTIIVDSHVICGYLVDKYGKNDKLYPKDLLKRAHVNSRLFYNACNVFSRIRFLFEPVLFEKSSVRDEWKMKYIEKTWEVIDRFVSQSAYVCGDDLTIADLALLSSVSSINEIVAIDPVKYPNLTKWFENLRKLPYYQQANEVGAKGVQQLFRDCLVKNASA